jgi:hypothetical protein
MKRVGMLTGGGDAPGLNAVIRGIVTRLAAEKADQYQCIGFIDGWAGLRDDKTTPLNAKSVGELIYEGGTILGTSRTNLYKNPEYVQKAIATYKKHGLDALVAIGGDDTLEIGYYLNRDHKLNIVGVPKTIDNDVNGTDFTFGFWSSVDQAARAIDDLRVTTMSHHRVMVVECMGRHAGWITAYAGMATAADFIAVPERSVDIKEICDVSRRQEPRHRRRRRGRQGHRRRGRPPRRQGQGRQVDPVHRGPARLLRQRHPPPRRGRRGRRRRDPEAHRLRGPRHRPGPPPARRLAEPLRPDPRHPVRRQGRRGRHRWQVRPHRPPQRPGSRTHPHEGPHPRDPG